MTAIDVEKVLKSQLQLFGQVYRNIEYHTDRPAYDQWFSGALDTLKARELSFKDPVECYMKIFKELKGK